MASQLVIRRIVDNDRDQVRDFLRENWGSSLLINSKAEHEGSELPGFILYADGFIVGLLTYHINGEDCELVSLNSSLTGRGVGSMLLRSLEDEANEHGCKRIWAITTNDNTQALRFYQKRGYEMEAIYFDSLAQLRERKPSIPAFGQDGIALRSEVEMVKRIGE